MAVSSENEGQTAMKRIGLVAMAADLGWRRPHAFGDEDYLQKIIAAYTAKHGSR